MSATSNRNYQKIYIILATMIFIFIATILCTALFKKELLPLPLRFDNTDEKSIDDTKIKNGDGKEEPNQENKTDDNIMKTVVNLPKNTDEEDLHSFEYSYFPTLLEKVFRYSNEGENIAELIRTQLSYALKAFRKTHIDGAIRLLEENQQILTPDCPGILYTSKLLYRFDETQERICENHKSVDDLLEKPMELELLNFRYINEIFENGDIKNSIKLKNFRDAKKSSFRNVPISILVDLEIGLLEIKENCFKYTFKVLDRFFENKIFLLSEYKKLKDAENQEESKKILKQFNLDTFEKIDLETTIDLKDQMSKKKEEALKRSMEILAKLNKLNVYIMGKRRITKK